MKATVKRRTAGWLLLLADRSDFVMSTAGLGERTYCYGVLDDSVKPYLITRLPLVGASNGEWAPVIDPGHAKYGHVRQSYRKSRGSPPPLWLQRVLYRRDLRKVTVKVKVVALTHCSGPRQQQHVRTTGVLASLAKGLCHVFHTCTSMPFLVGYAAVVIEILLMLAGDVERNPGPVGMLNPHDLVTVLTALLNVSADWYEIGLALRMSLGTLDSMRGPYKGPRDCMKDMLKEWLNTSPDPSWEGLVAALRSPIVRKQALARQLEVMYCTQELPPVGEGGVLGHDGAHPSTKGANVFAPSVMSRVQGNLKAEESKQYEEALAKGKVICHIVVALLIGIAGAGKTSVKELLLGNTPPSAHKSTYMVDAPQIPVVHPTSLHKAATLGSSSWRLLKEKEFQEFIIKHYGINPADQSSSSADQHTDSRSTPSPADQHTDSPPSADRRIDSNGARDEAVSDDILELGKEFQGVFDQLQGERDPIEVTFIYLIDSGGQPQFQELLPAFVKKPTAALCVTKLSEQFDDYPELPYSDRSGKKCGKPSKSILNNGEILTRYFQVLQSRQSATGEGGSPNVFVIGTHKDLEKPETRPEKNKMLRDLLEPKVGEKLVWHSIDEVIFPVNAAATEGKDCEEAKVVVQDLRKKIEERCRNLNPAEIPLAWFLLEMLLMELAQKRSEIRKVNVFKLKDCEQAAAMLRMDPKECRNALKFLSDNNILFYDPDNLPDVVFVSSQVLVSIVTALVYLCYVLQSEGDSEDSAELKRRCYTNVWRKFRSRGVLTSELLCSQEFKDVLSSQMFGVPYEDGVFTPDELLRLLRGLHIVAPVESGSSEYIMCCLLPELPQSEGNDHRQRDPRANVHPLVIEYPEMLLPAGIFTLLVGFLLNDPHTQWELAQTKTELKSNCVKFKLPDQLAGSVTLLHFVKYVEVHVQGRFAGREVCLKIKGDIHKGLKEAARILGYEQLPSPRECIFCPKKGHDGEDPYHLASMHPKEKIWVCNQNCDIEDDLDNAHQVWFQDSELGPQTVSERRRQNSGPDGSDEPDEAASISRKRKSSGGGGSAPKRRVLKRHSSSSPDGSDEPDKATSESRNRKSSGGGGSAPKRRVLKRHSSSNAHASPGGATAVSAPPQPVTSGNRELTQRDLGTLTNLLSGVDWHELGLQLGISVGQLKAIEEDYRRSGRRMSEMLFAWVKGTEHPTVGQLEAALKSPAVNEIQLARELIEEYTTP